MCDAKRSGLDQFGFVGPSPNIITAVNDDPSIFQENSKAGVTVNTTSASLLERLREPSPAKAWDRFVELYLPLVHAWARRLGLQEADATDLVQDVFATLFEKLPHFEYDARKSFRAWLKTIVLNRWREWKRQSLRRRELDPSGLSDLADPNDFEEFWESEYRRRLAQRALALIQKDFQPATWNACWELVVSDRPAKEVARQLGITVGAAYAAKFRVLARLREELAGLLE